MEDTTFEKVPDKTEYDAIVNTADVRTDITIGGETEKFVPNINASKWDDECWLNINHPDVVNSETETFVDDKIEIEIGNNIHRYYVKPNGRLEYEIVLKAKPVSNKIELDLDFPDGLSFIFQGTSADEYVKDSMGFNTFEEFESGITRPDNTVNSYIMMWKKSNNQYKTGIFGCIYRLKATDTNKNELWLNQDITGKKWTIEIDQAWLNNATYPVTIGPDLGNSTQGIISAVNGGDSWTASHDTSDGTGGNTIQMHVYCKNESGSTDNFKVAIYDDDAGNNRPEDRLLTNVEVEVLDGFDGKKDVNYVTALAANTKYWLAKVEEAGLRIETYYVADGANRHNFRNGAGYELSANWTDAGTNNTTRWNIWADYAAAGGSPGAILLMDHFNGGFLNG